MSVRRSFLSFVEYKTLCEVGGEILYLNRTNKIPQRDHVWQLLENSGDPWAGTTLSRLLACTSDSRLGLTLPFEQGWQGMHPLLGAYSKQRARLTNNKRSELNTLEIAGVYAVRLCGRTEAWPMPSIMTQCDFSTSTNSCSG